MTDGAHCPCCDAEDANLTPIESLALGVALGSAFPIHSGYVTGLMCPTHRMRWVMAMLRATEATDAGSEKASA